MILDNFNSVACREYTLPRDDRASQPKGWIQGNMRIEPVLARPIFQHFKNGRIWSVGQDNSHSWIRISHGMVKYVIDSIEDNTEIPADPQEEESATNKHERGCRQVKSKELAGTATTMPIHQRRWIDIEPSSSSTQSDVAERRRWSN